MKSMTVAEETRRLFSDAKLRVKLGKENTMYHISGTLNKRSRMYKEIERYRKDAEIDYELGVIKKDEYDAEKNAIGILEKSVANMKTY